MNRSRKFRCDPASRNAAWLHAVDLRMSDSFAGRVTAPGRTTADDDRPGSTHKRQMGPSKAVVETRLCTASGRTSEFGPERPSVGIQLLTSRRFSSSSV